MDYGARVGWQCFWVTRHTYVWTYLTVPAGREGGMKSQQRQVTLSSVTLMIWKLDETIRWLAVRTSLSPLPK